ncbi:MAG TPA: hypothetical protein VGE78_09920, partial [Agromyces sp.]
TVTLDGDEHRVSIAPGPTEAVEVDARGVVELAGVAGVHATVAYSGERALSSFAVRPPGPLDSPLRVYPH